MSVKLFTPLIAFKPSKSRIFFSHEEQLIHVKIIILLISSIMCYKNQSTNYGIHHLETRFQLSTVHITTHSSLTMKFYSLSEYQCIHKGKNYQVIKQHVSLHYTMFSENATMRPVHGFTTNIYNYMLQTTALQVWTGS